MKPSQIYGFTQDNEYSWHNTVYSSIKFIYLHNLTYIIKATTCVYGGRINIDISPYSNVVAGDITISPDHIVV